MSQRRYRKDKWAVYGEYGGYFTNLKDAKECAKEASKSPEYDFTAEVWNLDDGFWYIKYHNGRLVWDGWTIKK